MSTGHVTRIVQRKSLFYATCDACFWSSRYRKDKAKVEAFAREHEAEAPPLMRTVNEEIVRICIESRKLPTQIQAAALRDQILSLLDPHMMIAQQLREEPK